MSVQSTLKDFELLIRSHFPIIFLETDEEERAAGLLNHLADHMRLPFFSWTPTRGLVRGGQKDKVYGSQDPAQALDHIESTDLPAIYHFRLLASHLKKPPVIEKLQDVAEKFKRHPGAIVLTGEDPDIPPSLARLITTVPLAHPTKQEYYELLKGIVRDVSKRMHITVNLPKPDLERLLGALHGLTMLEAEKALTKAIIVDQRLDSGDIREVLDVKRTLIEREGVLEYYPQEASMDDIAGLAGLKAWLQKRKAIFLDPEKAAEFGLEFPKGILLLGVQGCGKSLCAKVVAKEWGMPLLKLDPSNLYNKYIGESEKNLKKAIRAAEAMAPLVLWIDEIEKALSGVGDSEGDGGVSQRIFGTLLSWLQDKKASIFVIATSNDISALPPELLRKGRFDEIFFVDLPDATTRQEVFRINLKKKKLDPDGFDIEALANAAEGFSGAEIEQAVVSALYSAFSDNSRLTDRPLLEELRLTRPLSKTMAEKIDPLRAWSRGRTVSAD